MPVIEEALNLLGEYSLIPYNRKPGDSTVCTLLDGFICNLVLGHFIDLDPSIDYLERYDMYMSNLPSGAGYHAFTHYG